jgi:hypothetical protein
VAEVTPEPPASGSGGGQDIGGLVIGAIAGLMIGIIVSIYAILTASAGGVSCGNGLVGGIIELLIAGSVLALAWHLAFRVKAKSFGISFLRAASLAVGVMLILPWPCSLGWTAVSNIALCWIH